MNQFYKPGSGCLVQPCLPLIGLYRWCVHGVYHSKVVEALDVKLYDFVIYKLKLDKTRLMCLELSQMAHIAILIALKRFGKNPSEQYVTEETFCDLS